MPNELKIKSSAFKEGAFIPRKHSARGEDLSPEIRLDQLHPEAVSIAITMDDSSHPLFGVYNHWLIWNVPATDFIPEGIPHGIQVEELGNAKQGRAYGRHRYKGPKPPLKSTHTYTFTIYVLNCFIDISEKSRKKEFMEAAEGHILQQGTLSGLFQSRR